MFFGNIFLYVCWQIVEKYGNKSVGVFIIRTEDYLTDFYPTFQSILKLYYSLAAVNNEANESGKTEFTLIYQPWAPFPYFWEQLTQLEWFQVRECSIF